MLRALAACCATACGPLAAQVANEFDFDKSQWPATAIAPNGASHTITSLVTYTNQNLTLQAPLVVASGAELRLVGSVLKVFGNVLLQDGGRITVIDSSLLLPNAFQRQYEIRQEGGLLHCERAVIGGTRPNAQATLFQTRYLHLRGTFLARDTALEAVVTVLANGRTGWFNDPRFKGGSVFGVGVYEGENTDAIHLSGMGDVSLARGTMNLGYYFDASGSAGPASTTIDLESRVPVTAVVGDPLVHNGVTVPVAGCSYRLELRDHRSPAWQLYAVDASSSGPLQTITLRNAEDVVCSFRGTNLAGSPVLGGPWASHYAVLPGLPSTMRPGHHALPPGCSVRLGNVVFQSGPGPTDWNRIRAWGLYSRGAGTNLSVTGPTHFAEIQLEDGQMTLAGTGSFDMEVFGDTVRLTRAANLQITNGSIGAFGFVGTTGLIEVNDTSSCTLTNVRTAPVRLKTTSAAASIVADNVFGAQNLVLDNAGGGTITVRQAAPTQNTDLQNLGFESSLLSGNVPPYWAATAVTGSLAADAAPGSTGARSYELVAQAANATLQKQLTLPAGTFVTVLAAAKVLQAPAGGALLRCEAGNGTVTATKALDLQTPNTWQRVQVPLLTVGATGLPTAVRFVAAGLPATVRLDDVRVHIGSWWDFDNLANLDFELGCLYQGAAPLHSAAPDAWRGYRLDCTPAPGVVRPGSTGAQSICGTLQAESGNLTKVLSFLRRGDTAVVRGWVRGVSSNPAANIQAIVGDGPNYYVYQYGPNQHSGPLACDGAWRQFTLTYVVPINPSSTYIDLSIYDAPGTQCWFDDVTVEIR
jgi:hypothetical protein